MVIRSRITNPLLPARRARTDAEQKVGAALRAQQKAADDNYSALTAIRGGRGGSPKRRAAITLATINLPEVGDV